MKVIGYIRVSTERQADEGFGLDVQEKAIRTWARANRHRLVGIFRDEGVSGAKDSTIDRDWPTHWSRFSPGRRPALWSRGSIDSRAT